MKLTRAKLIETIRRKNEGWTTYQARKIAGISIRRVNQVWNEYLLTNEVPDIGKLNGRPSKPVEEWEMDMVRQTYLKYRVSADTLERLILRDFQKHIGHNRIHKILLTLGFAKKKNKKDIRKKDWIRYERRHSLTAVHIDWHYDGKIYVFAVIDDASRKLLLDCIVNSFTKLSTTNFPLVSPLKWMCIQIPIIFNIIFYFLFKIFDARKISTFYYFPL